MMKKRNGKQVKVRATRKLREAKSPQKQMPVQKQEVFSSVCEKVILHTEETNETSVDYYFCKAVIAREAKVFQTERQAGSSESDSIFWHSSDATDSISVRPR